MQANRKMQIFIAVLKNIRLFRIVHYSFLIALGMIIALEIKGAGFDSALVLKLVFTLLGFGSAWLFAVFLNDIFDYDIDKISNTERPLVSGTLSIRDCKFIAAAFLVLTGFFGVLSGYHVFVFLILFTLLYGFIYSAPPFRLRKFFLIPNIIIGLCSLAAIMAGFAIVFGDQTLIVFPRTLALAFLGVFVLASNLKDLKDYEGDKAAGIKTIPSVFGLKYGRRIIGVFIALFPVILLSPLMSGIGKLMPATTLVTLTIPFMILGYWFTVNKSEKWVFSLEFIFMIIVAQQII
jgi:4-hydroxybenzoate polyprenyltransferase